MAPELTEDELQEYTAEEIAAMNDDSDDELEKLTLDELDAHVASEVLKAEDDGVDDTDTKEPVKEEKAEVNEDKPETTGKESDAETGTVEEEVQEPSAETNNADAEDTFEDVPEAINREIQQQRLTDTNSKIESLKDARLKLADDLDSGDLTNREYREKLDKLEGHLDVLKNQAHDINADFKNNSSAAEKDWLDNTVGGFLAENKEYENDAMFTLLDATVKDIQKQALHQGKSEFSPTILAQAHARIKTSMPGMFKATPAEAGKTTAKEESAPKPNGERPSTKSLADTPGTAEPVSDSKYAALDRLEGKAYEDAVEALTPAEYEQYLEATT